ncbi:hypothetical protein [Nannocystis punicea]|uniref:Myxococcus cysteine-rich repeat-containing protein n=1 Tax=Nannocystis punicea TaxID=2995304 RepID=A0ABY7HFT8_9BACT|nr:hypothetical protein [Nannocystis poenicansa]WAS98156.1 hypothetical protein O0S08_18610 [Nannocystis poenicansa]
MRLSFGACWAGVAYLFSWLVTTGCNPGRSDAASRGTDSEGTTLATPSEGGTTGVVGASSTGEAGTGVPATGTGALVTPPPDLAPELAPTPVEPCESHAAEGDCDAAGCIWFATERVADRSSCALEPAGFCATASASTGDEDYDSAFFKRVGDVVHLRRVGRKSSDFPGPEHPAGWTECGLGPGDPDECACVCAAGRCPGDIALALLDACGAPRPCDDEVDGDACLYQSLAAAAAASLRLRNLLDGRSVDDRVFLRGDGTATWMRSTCDPRDHSCSDRKWELPRLCTLRDRAVFTACAASAQLDPQCRDVAAWFTDCKLAPPTCP